MPVAEFGAVSWLGPILCKLKRAVSRNGCGSVGSVGLLKPRGLGGSCLSLVHLLI